MIHMYISTLILFTGWVTRDVFGGQVNQVLDTRIFKDITESCQSSLNKNFSENLELNYGIAMNIRPKLSDFGMA